MAKGKDPAFLFYPGDYLQDTQNLSESTQVAYDRIMCEHMRNICISQKQLKFFTKRLSDDEKEELMLMLTEVDGGFQIGWVAESIEKRRAYSESRRNNRLKKKDNTSETYDTHMVNENEIEIENTSVSKVEKEKPENYQSIYSCYLNCLEHFSEHLIPTDDKQKEKWIDTLDKLNRIDNIPFEEIYQIVKGIRNDGFWAKNFLSLTKLRKKNGDGVPYIVVFHEHLKSNRNGKQSGDQIKQELFERYKKRQAESEAAAN